VLFARALFPELMQLTGDRGGRPVIQKHANCVAVVQVDAPAQLDDIDTREDYAQQMEKLAEQNRKPLAGIRAVVSDMDGVLWRGNSPTPGLGAFFAFLRQHRLPFILATNNATRTAAQYAAKLAELGVQVSPAEILPSCDVAADYVAPIAPRGTRVFIVGEAALAESLTARGMIVINDDATGATADLVVAGLDRYADYKKLAQAARFIRRGAKFIGTNPDKTFPAETDIVPGAGSLLAFLEAATDVKPFIVAKPEPEMFKQAMARLGARPEETVMIGDRLETDILGGQRAGLKTLFVLSGIHTQADVEQMGIRPDWTFQDIGELTQVWQRIKAEELALSVPASPGRAKE